MRIVPLALALLAAIPACDCDAEKLLAERSKEACRDGVDNDKDGYVDCADQDCQIFVFCLRDASPVDRLVNEAIANDAPQTDGRQRDELRIPDARLDSRKPDAPKPDAPKPDAPKPDAPKPDVLKPDAPKPDLVTPCPPGSCMSSNPPFCLQLLYGFPPGCCPQTWNGSQGYCPSTSPSVCSPTVKYGTCCISSDCTVQEYCSGPAQGCKDL